MNILTLNEWQESPNYLIDKWFFTKKRMVEKWFNNEALLNDLEFDYFEYDSVNLSEINIGYLFFNERDFQFKIGLIIDVTTLDKDTNIEDFTVTLSTYNKESDQQIGEITREKVTNDEFTADYIIQLINDFKTEFKDDLDIDPTQEEIEEEIQEKLNDKIKLTGTLITNKNIRNQEEIYSDIRSLAGITIINSKDIVDADIQDRKRFRVELTVKIDKYPFRETGFSLENIVKQINSINGVVSYIVPRDKIKEVN